MEPSAPRVTESAEIDKLSGALSKAVPEFDSVVKDRTAKIPTKAGGSYAYNYADLASVLRAVTPALAKNGLALIQRTIWDPNSMSLILESRLCHESGQWIAATYPLPSSAQAQELGSAITYGRRYTASGMLGVASEEDDDGDTATHGVREAEITTKGPKENHPDCENCDVNDRVILSKFPGKKYYCLACRKNFGPDNSPASEPGAAEAAELFTDGEVKPAQAKGGRKPKPLPTEDSELVPF